MNWGFRFVKMADICLITVIYFVIGFVSSRLLDYTWRPFNEKEEEQKPLWQTISEILFHLIITALVVYILRNLVQTIPSPLNGLYHLDHLKVKEVQSAPMLTFSILYYQKNLQDRLKYTYNKL